MFSCFKMKKLLRGIICAAVVLTAVTAVMLKGTAENKEGVFVPVIMYHSIVGNDDPESDYRINADTLEEDLRYLKTHGYNSVFTEQLADYVYYGEKLPENPVVITADDGFYNNLYYLLPLLEKYDMKAVVSVVGYYSEVIAENDPHVPRYSYLTWEDINRLIESGRIEIGNHIYDLHSWSERKGCGKLSCESEEEYRSFLYGDLGANQELIRMRTGITPGVFTYPFGAISNESIPVLKELGFYCSFNCFEKPNYITRNNDCLYGLNRYNRPAGISTEEFMKKCLAG